MRLATMERPGDAHALNRRLDLLVVGGLVLLGTLVPLALAISSGSLVVAHNDDFNYRRVALDLYENGRLQLTGWTVMSLIGQLGLVLPFLTVSSGAPWAFGAMTAITAGIAFVAGHVLARSLLPTGRAVLATLTLIAFPGVLVNTTTFMTDVPALAAEMVSLALAAQALVTDGPRRPWWFVASLVVGCFAFSIREFALATPLAVLLVAAVYGERRRRIVAWAIGVAAACGLIYVVTHNLPGQGSPVIALSPQNVRAVLAAFATLAFGLSPVLMLAATQWRGRLKLRDLATGMAAAAVLYHDALLDVLHGTVPTMLVGNLLMQEGAPGSGVMAGMRPPLFASPTWEVMNLVALGAVIAGCGLLVARAGMTVRARPAGPSPVSRTDPRIALLVAFSATYALGIVLFGLVASIFDRYLWPLVVPVATLLLLRSWSVGDPAAVGRPMRPRATAAVSGVLLAGLLSTAVVLFLNSAAFDAARWRLGEIAVIRGYARTTVDAGMEWVGFYASGVAAPNTAQAAVGMWYAAWWPGNRTCALVSSSLLDDPALSLAYADTEAYRLLLVAGPETPLYLYEVANPGCG